ncbi:MAG: DUF1467 family protein [Pseudomonadota bacterium]
MGLVGAVVLYAVFWFICLFLVLPHGQPTQIEDGDVERGTPGGAPAHVDMNRKFLYATIGAAVIVGVIALIVNFRIIVLEDFAFLFPASFFEPPPGAPPADRG